MSFNSRNFVLLLGKESGGYGTIQLTPTSKFADPIVIKKEVGEVELRKNTGTLAPQSNALLQGLKSAIANITDAGLTDEHIALIQAFTGDTSSPYTIQSTDQSASYSLFNYDNSTNYYDKMLGARLEKLTISGEVGQPIKISAVWRGKSADYDIEDTGGDEIVKTSLPDTDTSAPNNTVMMFHDTTVTFGAGAAGGTKLMSFTLELTNNFADDKANYQNSQTKEQDVVCHVSGTLTYTYLSNSTNDSNYYDNLIKDDISKGFSRITITDGTNSWQMDCYGKYTGFEKDTSVDCLVPATVTLQLFGDSSNAPFTLTRS